MPCRGLSLLALAALAALSGCGPQDTRVGSSRQGADAAGHAPPSAAPRPRVGVYTIDVERSGDAIAKTLAGETKEAVEAARKRMRETYEKGGYRLALSTDGTFTLTMDVGGQPSVFTGTWADHGTTLTMVTKTMDGQPIDDDSTATDTVAVEGDSLVMTDGGRKTYLKRIPGG